MAEKSINVQAGYYSLTVINGDNVVLDNKPVISTGSSTLKKFTVDTDLQTRIQIKLPKYYGVSTYPVLNYYQEYDVTVWNSEEFEQIDSDTFALVTTFEKMVNPTMRLSIMCSSTMMYAYVYTNLTNCTCNIHGGNALPAETTFTLTCESNREFQITPQIDYGGVEVISEYLDKVNESTYSITLTLRKGYDYRITGEAVKKSAMTDKYPFTTAYRVTKEELRELA